jgi:hypothetical protein
MAFLTILQGCTVRVSDIMELVWACNEEAWSSLRRIVRTVTKSVRRMHTESVLRMSHDPDAPLVICFGVLTTHVGAVSLQPAVVFLGTVATAFGEPMCSNSCDISCLRKMVRLYENRRGSLAEPYNPGRMASAGSYQRRRHHHYRHNLSVGSLTGILSQFLLSSE